MKDFSIQSKKLDWYTLLENGYEMLSDSKWNGRNGYKTYFVIGSREEVQKKYDNEIKPQPQSSPSMSVLRQVEKGEELKSGIGEMFTAPASGYIIKIEIWAV